jgi:hypothetical protein
VSECGGVNDWYGGEGTAAGSLLHSSLLFRQRPAIGVGQWWNVRFTVGSWDDAEETVLLSLCKMFT